MTPEQQQEARVALIHAALYAVALAGLSITWLRSGAGFALLACMVFSLLLTVQLFRVAQLRGWLGR